MKFQQKQQIQPSNLTHGWHVGYLLRVQEEPKPEFFTQSTHATVWKWYFAIYQTPADVALGMPEQQEAMCSPIFGPGGYVNKTTGLPVPPTKSYEWVSGILGRPVEKGESPSLAEEAPHPCRIKVQREAGKDWVRLVDFEPWTEAPAQVPHAVQELFGAPPMPYIAQSPDLPVGKDPMPADIPF